MPGLVQTRHLVFLGRDPRQVAEPTDGEEASQLMWIPLTHTADLLALQHFLGSGTAVGMLTTAAILANSLLLTPTQSQVAASAIHRPRPASPIAHSPPARDQMPRPRPDPSGVRKHGPERVLP